MFGDDDYNIAADNDGDLFDEDPVAHLFDDYNDADDDNYGSMAGDEKDKSSKCAVPPRRKTQFYASLIVRLITVNAVIIHRAIIWTSSGSATKVIITAYTVIFDCYENKILLNIN